MNPDEGFIDSLAELQNSRMASEKYVIIATQTIMPSSNREALPGVYIYIFKRNLLHIGKNVLSKAISSREFHLRGMTLSCLFG